MLSKVDITTHIKKFTNALTNILVEITFKNYTRRNKKTTVPMHLVIQKFSLINVTINESHFSLNSSIVFPKTSEITSIRPSYCALTIPFPSFPLAFISSFLVLNSILAWKTMIVLHISEATRSAIFKRPSKFISIFEAD